MTADQYRSCASKIPHASRREAKQVARLTTTRWGGGSLDAYRCGYCLRWHVGHGRQVRERHRGRRNAQALSRQLLDRSARLVATSSVHAGTSGLQR
jgi:GH24 family phage-related lysozyme (muramidase)